jgi:single-strand DNA-binding protein
MAYSLNKAVLIGNVGGDPQLSYSESGVGYCRFSLATSYSIKNKEGNWENKTDWHNIVAFGKVAELCARQLKKGSKLYLEGKITYDEYEKDSIRRKTVSIIVNNIFDLVFFDKKDNTSQNTEQSGDLEKNNEPEEKENDLPF